MKMYSGDAQLKGNLDVLSDKPLDSRLVVQTKNDLYSLDSRYAYNGMPVACVEEEKIYMLKDKTRIMLESGWVECTGGSGGNRNFVVLSQAEYDALQSYNLDTLYFIYETWGFGENFPINLA